MDGLITTTTALEEFCHESTQCLEEGISGGHFIALDTEFMRESTYWPKLCLVQAANAQRAVAIDPFSPELSLQPFLDLLTNPNLLKVLHAGHQDLEIFWTLMGNVPAPLFDTQIAAMACGFGESISYEALVHTLTDIRLNKSAQRTNWELRPLSDQQILYALGDVIGLRAVYQSLAVRLDQSDRASWIQEAMAPLTDSTTYRNDPDEAWRRFRTRGLKRKAIPILQALAAAREAFAQRVNIPRSRLMRDDLLLELANHPPQTAAQWDRVRGLPKDFRQSSWGKTVLQALEEGARRPSPVSLEPEEPSLTSAQDVLLDLLKLVLKLQCDHHGLAPRLVASKDDLCQLARAPSHILQKNAFPVLSGWRFEVFGECAIALCQGRSALAWNGRTVTLTNV